MITVGLALYLLGAHFLCDFALQGDYMARVKNRFVDKPAKEWFWALGGHAVIHGAAVSLVLGNPLLGLAEVVMHYMIDTAKCESRIGYHTDQIAHVVCKAVWLALALTLFTACYAAREAEPCTDSGVMPMAGTQAVNLLRSRTDGSNPSTPTATYPGPCPFVYDAVHCWCTDATHEVCDGLYCEGPYVGCIAPGSPVSSTWGQR